MVVLTRYVSRDSGLCSKVHFQAQNFQAQNQAIEALGQTIITGSRTNMSTAHKGACFCGAIEIEVTGEPEGMGYCHCRSCRSWSGGPVNAFSLWKPGAVKVTKGEENVATFTKTPMSERKYCKKCGGHLMANHPSLSMVDVFAATIPTLKFAPGVHVNYAESVLPMKDGLPKFADFPSEFGGSGKQIAE
jgi:hypothetical protein